MRLRVGNDKDGAAKKFRTCARAYTHSGFVREFTDFTNRWPNASQYLKDGIPVKKWTRCYFEGDKYNIDTSNSAESMNNVVRKARAYPLLPMIDAIIAKMSEWFNTYRIASSSAPNFKKHVPYLENILHERCKTAKTLCVKELNSFRLEYEVDGVNGKKYLVNLRMKSCSCRCFDIDKYPGVHAIAGCTNFMKMEWRKYSIELYKLCSKYCLTQTWALAYEKTIYFVPHESDWNIPANIKELSALPPEYTPRKVRRQEMRFPSTGERHPKKKNKYNPVINLERWLELENS